MLSVCCATSGSAFASNTYIIGSDGEYAVIDPSAEYSPRYICGGKLKYIFLTHAHFDHMLNIDSWAEATGATVYVSHGDKDALRDSYRNCYQLFCGRDCGYFGDVSVMRGGDCFHLGSEVISVIETPGHTYGSVILLHSDSAFVGDTVFEGGGYGRWDLPGGNYEQLKVSIKAIMALDDGLALYPGHGEPTTVADFKKYVHLR